MNVAAIIVHGDLNLPAFDERLDLNGAGPPLDICNSIFRVDDQIEENLLHLMRITPRVRQVLEEIGGNNNVIDALLILTQLDDISNRIVQVECDALGFCFCRQAQKVLNDFSGPFGLRQYDVNHPASPRLQFAARNQLRVPKNTCQRIVQFVGDSRDEPADGRHLFEMNNLPAKLNFIRDLRGINDLHAPVVQRNRLEFIGSASRQFELVMRDRLDILNVVEKIGECRVG